MSGNHQTAPAASQCGSPRCWYRSGWGILLFAVCVRGVVLLSGLDSLQDDPDAYARLARNWSQAGILGVESSDGAVVVPTAFRPPLYPWFLSWLVTPEGQIPASRIASLHLCLGAATVWLTWSIAARLQFAWPCLPAMAVAVDPLLLRASQLVMTETLAAFLAVLAWRLWLAIYACECAAKQTVRDGIICNDQRSGRRRWLPLLGLGAVLGLSVLARPTAGPWVALIAVGQLCFSRSGWNRRLADCAVVSLLVAVCLAPWIVRNQRVIGKPLWATTHGGYTLLLANNPMLYDHFRRHGPTRDWEAEPFHARWALRTDTGLDVLPDERAFWLNAVTPSGDQRSFNELEDDALAYAAAWATIERQPGMFGLSAIYRLGWLWALWPNTGSASARIAIGAWYASMFALAIIGLSRDFRKRSSRDGLRTWWLPLSLVVSLSIVHAVYWSNMRMRGPAMAVVYIAAGSLVSARHWPRPPG